MPVSLSQLWKLDPILMLARRVHEISRSGRGSRRGFARNEVEGQESQVYIHEYGHESFKVLISRGIGR